MKIIMATLAMTALMTLSACSTNTAPVSNATRNAAIGAAAGAAAGKLTGDESDGRALKGAAIGAAAGYIYGSEVDKQNDRRRGY